MEHIKVMISSVVEDLNIERIAIKNFFESIPFVECIGAKPFDRKSLPGSSAMETIKMARDCDLYILLLSGIYGYKIKGDKSATEIEYETAIKDNPTKVLIFIKSVDSVDDEQKVFIDRVSDYHEGYFRTTFKNQDDLISLLEESFYNWVVRKCSNNLTCFEQFVEVVREYCPIREHNIYFNTSESQLLIKVNSKEKLNIIKYEKADIITNFWNCVKDFQIKFDEINTEE